MTSTVRPYEPTDLPQVLDLLRVSLGESEVNRRSPELFSWKHVDNPFGRSIMLVAEDEIGIVGFRAFMRWELVTVDRELIRCVRPVDTATHPRAQRRGIFRALTVEAVEAARLDGVDLIFNTPNPRSGAGYLTMGWRTVGRIGVLVRPIFRGLIARAEDLPSVKGAKRWDEAQTLVDRAPQGLRTHRTPSYLNWRFARHPTASYCVVQQQEGIAVLRPNLRKFRRELVVSDLFGDAASQALRSAARFTNAAYMVGWFSPGGPERLHAVAAAMIPLPLVRALTLVARPLRPDLASTVIGLEGWDLAMSDLELL